MKLKIIFKTKRKIKQQIAKKNKKEKRKENIKYIFYLNLL